MADSAAPHSTEPVIRVIIPAYNEEQSIGLVLREIPDGIGEVVVVDNGSTDSTRKVAASFGAKVLFEPRRGYGRACLKGLDYLKDRPTEIVVFLDGDYSDFPAEMGRLIQPIREGEADVVIGSRLRGGAEPGSLLAQARFGNWLACGLIRFFFGYRWTDLGPFRAIRYSALRRLNMGDTAFGWTVEMQIKSVVAGLRCSEAGVSYRRRIGISKITGTLYGTLMAGWTILGWIFHCRLVWRPGRSFCHRLFRG